MMAPLASIKETQSSFEHISQDIKQQYTSQNNYKARTSINDNLLITSNGNHNHDEKPLDERSFDAELSLENLV